MSCAPLLAVLCCGQSGCVGICVNLCKTATQRFFTEDVGMPLTMVPNWDDLSCDMVFGQVRGLPVFDTLSSRVQGPVT